MESWTEDETRLHGGFCDGMTKPNDVVMRHAMHRMSVKVRHGCVMLSSESECDGCRSSWR